MVVPYEISQKTDEDTLADAYNSAIRFQLTDCEALSGISTQIPLRAREEAADGQIVIDRVSGVTNGMRSAVLEPYRKAEEEWQHFKTKFDIALEPYKSNIEAVETLEKDIQRVLENRKDTLDSFDLELKQDPKFKHIEENYRNSKARYDDFRNRHRNRDAQMFSSKKVYWFVLALVLLTECFVNYHSFNAFWGVPAVALGTTLILGVLLALAAHQHGEIIKQWSFRFAPSQPSGERWTTWRMFALSTAALAIVLGFTGWARWAAAIEAIRSEAGDSVLGAVGIVQVNPTRDVLISLIANLGAWMVGVIISYSGHDRDPDYMAATAQYNEHRKSWEKLQADMKARRTQAIAQAQKDAENLQNAAETRLNGVKKEVDMLRQIDTHSQTIENALRQNLASACLAYRRALLTAAQSNRHVAVFLIDKDSSSEPSSVDAYGKMILNPSLFT